MAEELLDADAYHDANDCKALYERGQVRLRGPPTAAAPPVDSQIISDGIDFGDDRSEFANDGECDDPRFKGTGTSSGESSGEHRFHDASDCKDLYEQGQVTLRR